MNHADLRQRETQAAAHVADTERRLAAARDSLLDLEVDLADARFVHGLHRERLDAARVAAR